jgi:hypothetical protein
MVAPTVRETATAAVARSAMSITVAATAQTALLHPFHLHVDPMLRLLLINLDRDPDALYKGFEPQAFDDDLHGRGVIVIGWRQDGRVDVFHPPTVRLDPATYAIAGDGLHQMIERPLQDARFDIGPHGVDADVRFEDAAGRSVEVRIVERSRRVAPRIALLAPMGAAATAPSALPLVLMRDFGFVRRSATEAFVAIDGRGHALDHLPVPIDLQRMYFVRYAEAPLIATLNPAHSGRIAAIGVPGGAFVDHAGARHHVERVGGRMSLASIERVHGDQRVAVAFAPAFPNLLDLAEGAAREGRFTITSDPRVGSVAGSYALRRDGDTVTVRMVPCEGWRPRERRWSVRLMYRVNAAFRSWPSTYVWDATIDLSRRSEPSMASAWTRTA